MSIESINLRKCVIERFSENKRSFITKDLYDHSEKEVFLTGNQRMFYTDYHLGDIIYTAKSSKGIWTLITGTKFKTSDILYEYKQKLDEYFDNTTS